MTREIIQQQFLELVRADLFPDHNARILSQGKSVDWGMIYQLAEEQSVMGLVAAGIEKLPTSERAPKRWSYCFLDQLFNRSSGTKP